MQSPLDEVESSVKSCCLHCTHGRLTMISGLLLNWNMLILQLLFSMSCTSDQDILGEHKSCWKKYVHRLYRTILRLVIYIHRHQITASVVLTAFHDHVELFPPLSAECPLALFHPSPTCKPKPFSPVVQTDDSWNYSCRHQINLIIMSSCSFLQ